MSDETLLAQAPDAGTEPEAPTPEGGAAADTTTTETAQDSTATTTEGEVAHAEKPSVEYKPFTLPEGVEVDSALLDQAKGLFKEAGLSQESAQKLIDLYASRIGAVEEQRAAQVQEWVDSIKSDKELGGPEFEARSEIARKAVRQFGSPDLIALFESTGIGSHPELVRFAYRVGKALGEATFVKPGAAAAPDEQSTLRALYPSMYPKSE